MKAITNTTRHAFIEIITCKQQIPGGQLEDQMQNCWQKSV